MKNIIAILRGVTPDEVVSIAEAIVESGISAIEVPLNSPSPLDSISRLSARFTSKHILLGAGTVLSTNDVADVAAAGGKLIVSPNCNTDVIHAAKDANLTCYPGVLTPTECFSALGAGADGLKLFPAGVAGPAGLKDIRAVLNPDTKIYVVGGVGAANMADWRVAGATGFGIGSGIYRKGDTPETVHRNCLEIASRMSNS